MGHSRRHTVALVTSVKGLAVIKHSKLHFFLHVLIFFSNLKRYPTYLPTQQIIVLQNSEFVAKDNFLQVESELIPPPQENFDQASFYGSNSSNLDFLKSLCISFLFFLQNVILLFKGVYIRNIKKKKKKKKKKKNSANSAQDKK